MEPRVWLITGCSSGFGEQFVRQNIARGDKVIATGRNAATKLAHLKDTGAAILDLDVTISEAEIFSKINEAHQIYGRIDVLVNNAGYIESGAVEDIFIDRIQRSLDTNFFGSLKVTRAVLSIMREQKSGVVGFIGSMGGWTGYPASIAYSSSKFALECLADCLQAEFAALFENCVRFIIFEPGYFRTEVFAPTKPLVLPANIPGYEPFNQVLAKGLNELYGNEAGDLVKGVARMIDVLTGTGMAAGKELPPRLPLGTDGLESIRAKCQATLKICEDWEDLITSTDVVIEAKQ
ncbi:hydroxybutyrate dehydrogenase, putative [Talaromyces stipitatus ATCC 10500]|uniref:Hydroxybutyrate dehydrogenase, putative n=1 Tax=Talaromyces stipitatus (strain ATCC 10500 / CBS 375.48 / QM 6759 / NRRL 1006) TaxID=441959 RepID=B8MEB7_TALSN|nr:hydroxybutyrate dehydrogenase, putative [Talaromyces stipitatus ATCC 10500]EED16544.1 hydroxybutyrate dehydrogenase, putative [Talaromyces stipitatus ATCC 10500]